MSSAIFFFGLLVGATGQVRPPNFSPDHLPETDFTCEDKVTGGYYADVEAHCQLFHVCVQVSEYEFQDFHFLCPNDTVFDQQHLVCTNWFEVDCHAQLQFFTNDFGVRSEEPTVTAQEDEDVRIKNPNHDSNSRLRNTGRGQVEVGRKSTNGFRQNNFFQEEVSGPSTPIPLGFTTTIRPPGQPAQTSGLLSGRNLRTFNSPPAEDEFEPTTAAPPPPTTRRPSFRSLDGRRPKVKSNLKAKFRNSGKKFSDGFERKKLFGNDRRRGRFNLGSRNNVASKSFVEPTEGPEVRPDGREPRVKGNLLAEIRNKPDTTTIKPFLEDFFASPSSPQPFVFRGSPDPFADDLFPSATTAHPFFVPTPKSFSGISQTPEIISFVDDRTEPTTDATDDDESFNSIEEDEEEAEPTTFTAPSGNRFRTRPSPARFDRRRGPASRAKPTFTAPAADDFSSENVSENEEEDNSLLANTRHPKKNLRKKFRKNSFVVPSGGRRPRVKSNITARKRNFWHSNFKTQGKRKLRRGRKQRVQVPVNVIEEEEQKEEEEKEVVTTAPMEEEQTNPIRQLASLLPTAQSKPETTKPETDIFEDLFEQQDDLIVSSSTVSSVVFKGSPAPSLGFFSSPSPSFDKGSGVFVASPRPTFNNIGNDIDLGPKKFLSPNSQVFVTSTQSNKIFIGSPEETTPSPTLNKRPPFPSFPIRGKSTGSLSFPFRPKAFPSPTDASTTTTTAEVSEEVSQITPLAPSPRPSAPRRSNPFRSGANRNFKSLFNRKRVESSTLNFDRSTEAEPTLDPAVEELADNEDNTTVEEESRDTTMPISRPTSETVSTTARRRFSFSTGNRNFKSLRPGFRGRGRKEETTATVAITTESLAPITTTTLSPPPPTPEQTPSSILSVESELEQDNEIDNEIIDIEEPKTTQRKGFRRFSGIKKANRPPPNANIRVEFKKASAVEELDEPVEEEAPKKFFVKPDGRKPRVKSNIRARLAHKGKFGAHESTGSSFDSTGFRHSTRVHDLEFNGDPELEHADNTEKREINPADISIQDLFYQEPVVRREVTAQRWAEETGEIYTEKHHLPALQQHQQYQQQHQQQYQEQPIQQYYPPQQYQQQPQQQYYQQHEQTHLQESHEPDVVSPVEYSPAQPLMLNTRPSSSRNTLLEQMMVKHDEIKEATVTTSEPVVEIEEKATPPPPPSLTAFQALLSQTKSGFPLQLLNTREQQVTTAAV